MKKTLCFIILTSVCCHAQTIHSADKQHTAKLPRQFIVSVEGLKWIQPGVKDPVVVKWDKIDLEALAKEEPQIEDSRQKVFLTQKNIYISIPPPKNYYKEFLSLPVNVQFKEEWKAVSSGHTTYNTTVDGYATTDGVNTTFSGTANGTANSSGTTKYVQTSRQALGTTMEGFLLSLSKDGNLDSHRLIHDIQDAGSQLQNVRTALQNLREAYPKDIEIPTTIAAVDKLISERITSVDAMRQLGKFVEYARNKKVE